MDRELQEKYEKLKQLLAGYDKAVISFSGGVDSTFLLCVAKQVLGENMFAVTASLNSCPQKELEFAKDFCKEQDIKHKICEIDELSIEGFSDNPPNRCYICKKVIFNSFLECVHKEGFEYVCEGSNLDDEGDYRPGLVAIKELGIKSPLKEAGLTKADIRALSKDLKLPTWDKPSYACLSSRFVYGEKITKEKLMMVERAEELLDSLGFVQARVRIHGLMARVEVMPEDFGKIVEEEIRKKIVEAFSQYGFSYTSLDLKGYRTGSMNEMLNKAIH